MTHRLLRVVVLVGGCVIAHTRASAQSAPAAVDRDYYVYVGSEGVDRIAIVRFGSDGAQVLREFRIGHNPTELVGPHGIAVARDGQHVYVSTAHGTPFGELWKYTTTGDVLKGTVTLGNFPATLQVSPDGAFAYVVNFNLHGDRVPSSVSIVYLDQMVEVARVRTCTMPHGSRLNADGSRHYSACMMDDLLVEIDTKTYKVSRHFLLSKGQERGMSGAPETRATGAMAGHDMSHGLEPTRPGDVSCSPTWAQPSVDGTRIWVACNKSNDVLEVDATTWTMRRRIPAGDGVYNLAASPDGTLLVTTNKRGQSVSIIDAENGRTLATVATSRQLPSGVTVSTDSRYAFVTNEGIGSEPGAVDVIDLRTRARVASVNVGQQAGGIDFWKSEPRARR